MQKYTIKRTTCTKMADQTIKPLNSLSTNKIQLRKQSLNWECISNHSHKSKFQNLNNCKHKTYLVTSKVTLLDKVVDKIRFHLLRTSKTWQFLPKMS